MINEGEPVKSSERNPAIVELMEDRNIREEDAALLDQIFTIPQNDLWEFHNLFNVGRPKEVVIRQIENMLKATNLSQNQREYCSIMLEILDRYDVYVANHLRSLLEQRK